MNESVNIKRLIKMSYNVWGKHFEDFKTGQKFTTLGRTSNLADILLFSSLTGDFATIHTDEEHSKKGFYKTRINHGLLTFALSQALIARGGLFENIEEAQFLNLNNLRFTGPVLPGDTLTVDFEIVDMNEESDTPGYGIMTINLVTKNQRGEVVCRAETSHLKRKRIQ
jgi:acyl dehydratase